MEHIAVEWVVYAELDLPTNNYLIEEAKEMEEQKQSYSEEELLQFSEWVSHNDWVYLPSKGYWVNEEEEESEQKFTTKELLEIFKNK